MNIEEAIYGRRSIRSFQQNKVNDEDIKKIIHAGTYAPSACNFQAWKFIIIDDENVKDKIVAGGRQSLKDHPRGFWLFIEMTLWLMDENIRIIFRALQPRYKICC